MPHEQRSQEDFEIKLRDGERNEISVRVSGDVYRAYLQDLYCNENQRKRERYHRVFSYSGINNDQYKGEVTPDKDPVLIDPRSSAEAVFEALRTEQLHAIMLDILYECLDSLKDIEDRMIEALFFEELSVKEFSQEEHTTIYAIYKRRSRTIAKLRKMIEDELALLDKQTYSELDELYGFGDQDGK